jgi:hypothetical protein
MDNLYFTLATHIVSIILLIIFFTKPKIDNVETKIFGYMLIVSLIESVLAGVIQILTYNFYSNPVLIEGILLLFNKIYYIFLLYWISLLFT